MMIKPAGEANNAMNSRLTHGSPVAGRQMPARQQCEAPEFECRERRERLPASQCFQVRRPASVMVAHRAASDLRGAQIEQQGRD